MDSNVKFETGELEMAIVTYNRCEFVEEWLKNCYEQVRQRNIHLSIYDSSTNDETEKYIEALKKQMNDTELEYYHVDSDISIGYKPMLPILNSKCKYVWVSGDSRCHDFKYLDQKVFPYLKKDIDYVTFHIVNNEENDGKIYTAKEEILRDCFLSMTCIGLSIYKTTLFDSLKTDVYLRDQCDKKYKMNYGFAWIGYFLEMFAMGDYKALFSIVPINNINAGKKVQSWYKKFYGCWIEDLCNLMDGLSEKYHCVELVVRDTWKYMGFDNPRVCYSVRKDGDLNEVTYEKYKNNGMLERVTGQVERIEKFAKAANEELDLCLEQEIEAEGKYFENLYHQNQKKIEECAKGKELWIYGAGTGGKHLIRYLRKNKIHVCGFLDKNADKIKYCEEMSVKNIDDINPQNCFVIISVFYYTPFILKSLLKCGVERKNILYIAMDAD